MTPIVILLVTAIGSLAAGMLGGLLGIGGGLVMVPIFHYLLKMNLHTAVGTSLAIIVPTALVGASRHASGHYVDWKIFVFAGLFALIGSFIGAGVSMSMDVTLLRKVFAVFLVLVALKMFLQ